MATALRCAYAITADYVILRNHRRESLIYRYAPSFGKFSHDVRLPRCVFIRRCPMTHRFGATVVARSYYDDMPLSLVLFRFFWPFWLFRDASSGDRYVRAAAYRHNRDMRVYLPGYLMKWLLSCTLIFALASGLESLSRTYDVSILSFIAAAFATVFACGVCVLFVTAYIYLYLSRNDP